MSVHEKTDIEHKRTEPVTHLERSIAGAQEPRPSTPQRHTGDHPAAGGSPSPRTVWRHQSYSFDRVAGGTGRSDLVSPHSKAALGPGWNIQPSPPTTAAPPVSQATDAPGGDAAPVGWQPAGQPEEGDLLSARYLQLP